MAKTEKETFFSVKELRKWLKKQGRKGKPVVITQIKKSDEEIKITLVR